MAGPRLRLAVQYASDDAAPSRPQVRRWVVAALSELVAGGARIDDATFTLRFVDLDEGRALNHTYRGHDHATNVLTFPLDDGAAGQVDADIVVCLPVVEREAREQQKTFAAHCAHLVVHGTLHACGHDHEADDDAATMEALEAAVLARFRIDDPYRSETGDDDRRIDEP